MLSEQHQETLHQPADIACFPFPSPSLFMSSLTFLNIPLLETTDYMTRGFPFSLKASMLWAILEYTVNLLYPHAFFSTRLALLTGRALGWVRPTCGNWASAKMYPPLTLHCPTLSLRPPRRSYSKPHEAAGWNLLACQSWLSVQESRLAFSRIWMKGHF